jgi:K+ transporter
MVGSGLLLGDGVITPAISVVCLHNIIWISFAPLYFISFCHFELHFAQLSAVEGLEIANASLKPAILPVTIVILYVLPLLFLFVTL